MPGQEADEDDGEENGCLVFNQKEANREVGIGKIGGDRLIAGDFAVRLLSVGGSKFLRELPLFTSRALSLQCVRQD